jgi:hypothetical protein
MRIARSLQTHLQQCEADGRTVRNFEFRLQLVRAVTRARCNNHSILMWRRISN